MADYECHALWDTGGNIDPRSIDLPADLADALAEWAADYTATLDPSDPRASGFKVESAAKAWLARGDRLAAWLRQQGYAVDYFHDGQRALDLVSQP
jgi:hypothetical protein